MASRRQNLLPPYLAANPAWVQLMEAIDEVFENEVDLPTELLAKLRDNWILGASGAAKIGDEKMLDNADWFRFERETLIRQANQLGFLLKETDLLTDEEYQRLVRNLGAFWYNKGTPEFIDFIRFILGSIIDVKKLFALPGPTYDTYGFMREEGDPLIGKLNYEFEEEFTPLLPTDVNAADTVDNGGPWSLGPNIQRVGRVLGPTGLEDAVAFTTSAATGASTRLLFALENNTEYEFEVYVRRLSGDQVTAGGMAVDTDFNGVAENIEREGILFEEIPLVWTKKQFRFKTGLFASAVASMLYYGANWDIGTMLAFAQPQLKKVTKTAVPGQWFETSHVNLVVDPLRYQFGTLSKVVALFNALANYHLVLNTIMFETSPMIHPPGEDIGAIVKAYPMIDIETTIYTRTDFSPPTVTALNNPTWTEGGDLIFNVTLSKASSNPFSLTYSKGGTATQDVDYTGPVLSNGCAIVGGVIQVPPDVSSFTLTFALIADGVSDPGETITLIVGGVGRTGTIT